MSELGNVFFLGHIELQEKEVQELEEVWFRSKRLDEFKSFVVMPGPLGNPPTTTDLSKIRVSGATNPLRWKQDGGAAILLISIWGNDAFLPTEN